MQILTLQKQHIPASFNMYLVINKCVTAVKVWNFSGHYLRNRSTLDIGESYVYWTVHHLDSWVKRNQLDATYFIILFNAQHVSDVKTSIFIRPFLFCVLFGVLVYVLLRVGNRSVGRYVDLLPILFFVALFWVVGWAFFVCDICRLPVCVHWGGWMWNVLWCL